MNENIAQRAPAPAAPAEQALLKLEEFTPYQLHVCATLASQALARICGARHNIGIWEWRVLVTLGQFGMMTAKSIGIRSHMHKTKVSRAVALLEGRKLVTRRANRADLREAFLSLTATGRAVSSDLAPLALDFERRLTETLDASERAAFDRTLAKLNERSAKLATDIANRTVPS